MHIVTLCLVGATIVHILLQFLFSQDSQAFFFFVSLSFFFCTESDELGPVLLYLSGLFGTAPTVPPPSHLRTSAHFFGK